MDQTSKPFEPLNQDWLWIADFQKGEHSAFEQIFRKYQAKVITLAFRFVREREAAEDIAQEVFIKVYEKKVKINPHSKFSTWLYRVTVNTSLDLLRRKKFLPQANTNTFEGDQEDNFIEKLGDLKSLSPREALEKNEVKILVQTEINRLPQKFRFPILLYQFQEMPYLEIAKILGITEKAVERRIYHAKELLKKKLSTLFP